LARLHRDERTIDFCVEYKKARCPDGRRRILTCGIAEGKLCVEWLEPAAPGVDSRWEMQLYRLVRTGKREKAIRFVQETRGIFRKEAETRVGSVASSLGNAQSLPSLGEGKTQ
jgi:hypothetical protein